MRGERGGVLGVGLELRLLRGLPVRWASRAPLTEMYSPSAIEIAPPTSAAVPAATTGPVPAPAPATPTSTAATETMPSFAPSSPARSQLSRAALAASSCSETGSERSDAVDMGAIEPRSCAARQQGEACLTWGFLVRTASPHRSAPVRQTRVGRPLRAWGKESPTGRNPALA